MVSVSTVHALADTSRHKQASTRAVEKATIAPSRVFRLPLDSTGSAILSQTRTHKVEYWKTRVRTNWDTSCRTGRLSPHRFRAQQVAPPQVVKHGKKGEQEAPWSPKQCENVLVPHLQPHCHKQGFAVGFRLKIVSHAQRGESDWSIETIRP